MKINYGILWIISMFCIQVSSADTVDYTVGIEPAYSYAGGVDNSTAYVYNNGLDQVPLRVTIGFSKAVTPAQIKAAWDNSQLSLTDPEDKAVNFHHDLNNLAIKCNQSLQDYYSNLSPMVVANKKGSIPGILSTWNLSADTPVNAVGKLLATGEEPSLTYVIPTDATIQKRWTGTFSDYNVHGICVTSVKNNFKVGTFMNPGLEKAPSTSEASSLKTKDDLNSNNCPSSDERFNGYVICSSKIIYLQTHTSSTTNHPLNVDFSVSSTSTSQSNTSVSLSMYDSNNIKGATSALATLSASNLVNGANPLSSETSTPVKYRTYKYLYTSPLPPNNAQLKQEATILYATFDNDRYTYNQWAGLANADSYAASDVYAHTGLYNIVDSNKLTETYIRGAAYTNNSFVFINSPYSLDYLTGLVLAAEAENTHRLVDMTAIDTKSHELSFIWNANNKEPSTNELTLFLLDPYGNFNSKQA
jgi:hypothetical protein